MPPASAESAKSPSAMIGMRIGTYRIVRRLGQGGMGAVYEAVHENIGQRAAIKVLGPRLSADRRQVERFFGEARAISLVQHPGLVKIFDYNRLPDGTVFILMELLHGESLWARYERLQRQGSWLGLQDALRITRQMASALAAVHEKGIVHRDLKPENVIVVPDPEAIGGERAKLVDFGIAKMVADFGQARQTAVGQALGTPIYMSPEQCRGSADITPRSDVYALGVMLYEMLAGRPPFVADEPGLIMGSHIFREPPPLAAAARPPPPPAVCALVHQMLAKKPEVRPDMTQVLKTLVQLESTGQIPLIGAQDPSVVMRAGPDGRLAGLPSPRPTRRVWPWRLMASAAAGGLLMAGLLLWLALRPKGPAGSTAGTARPPELASVKGPAPTPPEPVAVASPPAPTPPSDEPLRPKLHQDRRGKAHATKPGRKKPKPTGKRKRPTPIPYKRLPR